MRAHSRREWLVFREAITMSTDGRTTKSPLQLVTDIDAIIKKVYSHQDDPESLSKYLLELSVLSAGIGNHLVEALDEERNAKSAYEYEVTKRKLELVKEVNQADPAKKTYSATIAESMAENEWVDAKLAWQTWTKAVNMLKLKRQDVESVMDAVRSRLSLIKQDLRNTNG